MATTHAFPEFMCIGAQKAGTTWLHRMLRQHPQVWMPPIKEVQYFNQLYIPLHREWTTEHRARHGGEVFEWELRQKRPPDYRALKVAAHMCLDTVCDDWYREIFTNAPPGMHRGEMTPEYSLLPDEGVRHVASLGPESRFLLLLRDPVERAWSHARMFVGEPTPERMLAAVANADVIERGMYSKIIQRWERIVGAERLLVAFYDEIVATPELLLQRICAFFGLVFRPGMFTGMDEVVFRGTDLKMPDEVHAALVRTYRTELTVLADTLGGYCKGWVTKHS